MLRRLSQFESLNVEPLQELEKQRKGNKLKAVLIYGLDEGVGEDVQAKIIISRRGKIRILLGYF